MYSGGWVAGQPHGEGRFRETGGFGRDYQGEWRTGHLYGQGTFTYADGRKCAPTISPPDDPPHEGPLRYVGSWENDMRSGQGTATEADGSVYHSGLWKDNKSVK